MRCRCHSSSCKSGCLQKASSILFIFHIYIFIFYTLYLSSTLRPILSGSFATLHSSFSIIVSPFSVVYAGQCGNALTPLGLPVRIKLNRASAIFLDSFLGRAPPPVWVTIKSVFKNQKLISKQ